MAAFLKFNVLTDNLADGVHNWSSHTLKVGLTNTAPSAANTVWANITEISAGNGYTAGGASLSSVTTGAASGVMTLDAADVTITASGGSVGPFRYAVLYNDTPTSPADPLIGYWDYGSSITLADTETLTVQWAGTGILTITV